MLSAVETVEGERAVEARIAESRRPSILILAAGATIAGWLAASAALGIALPRAAVGAAALPLVLGPAAAVSLFTVAVVLLLRTTRRWGRLILLPWLGVVLVAVYSTSIAFAAAYPPRPAAGEPPSGATSASMTAADGTALTGWYIPSRNGAAVVLRHGAGSTASHTIAQARVLQDAGYGVLLTDARGHGASGGQAMALGWNGEADIPAAVDYLEDRAEVDPRRIAIVGLSMGGEEAIGAASIDQRICAVVAEGATGRTAADKAWLVEEYGIAGVVQQGLDIVTYALIEVLTPAPRPASLVDSLAEADRTPFLLIAAGDVHDEELVARRLERIDPSRVSIWVAPGAAHTHALQSSPEDWASRVVGFLDESFGDCER
jgi:pimeloyl-ACP methyl ester carboxylesterase